MLKCFSKIAVVVMVAAIVLNFAACDVAAGGSSATSSAAPQNMQGASSAQGNAGQPPQGVNRGAQPGGANMDEILAAVAEKLGLTTEEVKEAFNSTKPEMPEQGQPPSGAGHQSSTPPAGTMREPPQGGMPADGHLPPQGGGMPGMEIVYAAMAESLGIDAEDIATAFEEAFQEATAD
jgi:hypothetical protein